MGAASSIASLACCAGSCACSLASCCCSAATAARGGISVGAAKFWYVFMLGIATILSLVMRFKGDDMGIDLGVWNLSCETEPAGGGSATTTYAYCKGDAAVYRVSFVLALFFGTHVLVGLCGPIDSLHRGWWGPKIMTFVLLLVASIFISNNVFNNNGFAWVARIVSTFFLLFQILLLIDFGYKWNFSWVEKAYKDSASEYDGPSDKKWLVGVLVSAAALYIGALAGVGLMYGNYDCSKAKSFTTITLIALISYTVVALFRDKLIGVEGAILPAAVVAAYTVYLTWSALESNPDDSCRAVAGDSTNGWSITIGIIIAAASLMWTSFSASASADQLLTGRDDETIRDNRAAEGGEPKPFYRVDDGGDTVKASETTETRDVEAADEDAAASEGPKTKLWLFHFIMLTASLYMSMLITNWGAEVETPDGSVKQANASIGNASMWVKIISCWLTIAMYTWTLVAPKLLPDRDFE